MTMVFIDKSTIKKNGNNIFLLRHPPTIEYDEDGNAIYVNNLQVLHSIAKAPTWLFSYVPTKVKCVCCEKEFLHTELREEYDDYADTLLKEVCPYCGESFCCDIEFETIEQAMSRE